MVLDVSNNNIGAIGLHNRSRLSLSLQDLRLAGNGLNADSFDIEIVEHLPTLADSRPSREFILRHLILPISNHGTLLLIGIRVSQFLVFIETKPLTPDPQNQVAATVVPNQAPAQKPVTGVANSTSKDKDGDGYPDHIDRCDNTSRSHCQ